LPIILSTAQIKPIDNETASITKDEVKYITNVFVDFETLKEIHTKDLEKIEVQERIIGDKDFIIRSKDTIIELIKKRLEIVTPAWYDKFYYGFAAGVLVVIASIFVVK